MNDQDKNEIIKKIKSEISKTEKTILNYREITQPIAPENAIGRISRMDAINNKSIAEAALRKAQEKLTNLKYRNTQVHKKGFGCCAKCKQQIPVGRLLLVPQSKFCVKCSR